MWFGVRPSSPHLVPLHGQASGQAKLTLPPPYRKASGKQRGNLRPATLHTASSDVSSGATDVNRIDWVNLSHEDKQVFFTWLDEFFTHYLDQPQPFVRVSPHIDGPNISTPSPRPSHLSRLGEIAPRRVRTQVPTTWTLPLAAAAVACRNLPFAAWTSEDQSLDQTPSTYRLQNR
ncbi:hypothetical protein EDB89DRAFT_1294781 [Lactarius sanguifluus]|nr:hypothetical protein EDB89DRAFT_1294781 [Lactarius sanguifluus]